MKVLVVDDDDFALDVVESIMSRLGYSAVTARNGREAMEILQSSDVRLVITDWDMPEMNGIELCRAVRREELTEYVYVIMLTGREGARQRMEGLCAGADDFLNKPLDPEELLVCLKTAERILALETRDLALFALAKLAESRDSETGAHIECVQHYSRLIARNLSEEMKRHHGVDEDYIRLIFQTSPLHDLGKVGIPDAVLLKAGKLTTDEFAIMKTHTLVGAQTLDAALSRFPNARFLQVAREIAATHHEKFDGSGYPHGLAGEQIPLCGRIVAVADVYDALTNRRVYKSPMPHEQAKEVILRDSGSHFDPEVVAGFIRAEAQILEVRRRLCDAQSTVPIPVSVPIRPPPGQTSANPCTILVVEDDPLLLAKLVELLSATGEPVIAANDGEEAKQLLSKHNPRVVVSDWVMPKADGVELCRHIRSVEGAGPVYFIMLTAHSQKAHLIEAYEAGVNDFVGKPFDHEELLARVRAGIRAGKLQDDLVRKASGSQALNAQLATLNSRLERLAITDELTGLFNRRHAMSRLDEQWNLFDRYGRSLSVAMIDIDHFKTINDTRGHAVGDAVLRRIAGILRDQTRGTDTVCRVGGEEFLIIFPSQSMEEAKVCADRCRIAIADHVFNIGGKDLRSTVSIGLAHRQGHMHTSVELLKVADQALYAAKEAGRNRIHMAEELKASNSRAAASPSSTVEQIKEVAPALSYGETVLKRCGGDAAFATALADRFSKQAPGQLIEMEKALSMGNVDAVRRAAHTLKSMSAYVAADSATRIAARIEELASGGDLGGARPLIPQLAGEIESAVKALAEEFCSAA